MSALTFLGNETRARDRYELARRLWWAQYSQLIEYGISSYREITDMDTIGIPVWVAYRPPSTTVSVTAGKSPDRMLAFAGAIIEAIEFWAAEHPNTKYELLPYVALLHQNRDRPEFQHELLGLQQYALARDNVCDDNTPIAWEPVECLGRPGWAWMPSNMIWLAERSGQQFQDVQQTSNGLASGCTLEDAILQGLYELVERDGWTIERFIRDLLGTVPKKISLINLPDELRWTVSLMQKAGTFPLLFDCTTEDLEIPVIGCALFDREGVGLFGGYGAHLNPRVAAQRALLEAAQSRLCYINGARDDLYRRDFILMKRMTQAGIVSTLAALEPTTDDWPSFAAGYDSLDFTDPKQELLTLSHLLQRCGIDKIYYKPLRQVQFGDKTLYVVRVIAPQLEGVWSDYWVTNGRAQAALARESKNYERRSA
jgi:YcaO-like protein with predicted kinase domain